MSAASGDSFARLVELGCHDLRTPLATVAGFTKTLVQVGNLDEREAMFVGMMDEAAGQMVQLLDQLALAARIASGRYEPVRLEADTLELAAGSGDERVTVAGTGTVIETDPALVGRSLAGLALAALRFGESDAVTWTVEGRELTLAPVAEGAAAVLDGSSPRDLGALVARMAIERLGGSLALEGETLQVRL